VRLEDFDPDPDAVSVGFFFPTDVSLLDSGVLDPTMIGRL
jgi:hypothetical protein